MGYRMVPQNAYLTQYILDMFSDEYSGWGIDIGASDGVSMNTTYNLEVFRKWNILSIEPNPFFREELNKRRARVEICACGSEPKESAEFHVHVENPEAFSSLRPTTRNDLFKAHLERDVDQKKISWTTIDVPVKTLDQLIVKWEFPKLDLLCIDTEGTELDVLKGFDIKKWMPKVIVTECWDLEGPIDPYLESFGYKKLVRHIVCADNDVFVRDDS